MGKILVNESSLSGIASAIRSKNESSTTYKPSEMGQAILDIPTGGVTPADEGKVVSNGALVAQTSFNVTANGTYNTTTNNSVIVNVSGGGIPGVLTGTTAPSSNEGSDGDLYIRTYPLPENVTFVEYLESSGTQYIDTGFSTAIGQSLFVKALCEIDGIHPLMGGRSNSGDPNSSYDYGNAIQNFNSNIVLDYGYTSVSNGRYQYSIPSSAMYEVETGPIKYINNDFIYGVPSISSIDSSRILIFGMTNGNTRALGSTRIYRARIKLNGVIVADYLPALDGNGVACMYDAISGEYKYNSGTGVFTAGGADTPSPAPSTIYIKRGGSWAVFNQFSLS